MKHRYTIPFLDANCFPLGSLDVQGFAHQHGWHVESYEWHESRLLGSRAPQVMRVKLLPVPGVFPDSRAQVTAESGATLVYDDVEKTMGVTLAPVFADVAPPQPEDARPT